MKPFVNQHMLSQFKSTIDYPKLVTQLTNPQAVFFDIHSTLAKVQVGRDSWVRVVKEQPSIINNYQSGLDVVFENNDQQVIINIYVFSNTPQNQIFDSMLEMIASTSLPQVPYQLIENGPGALYFRSPQISPNNGDNAAYSLFGNYIIHANTVERDIDVREFITQIIQAFTAAANSKTKNTLATINPTTDKKTVCLNDVVTVEINPSDVNLISTDANLEGLENVFNIMLNSNKTFQFEALQLGDYVIPLQFMDSETMYSGIKNIPISVHTK